MKKLQKFLLFGALALLASCAMEMENGGDNGGGGGGVTAPTIDTQVTVLIPGGFGVVNTRALTDAQESEIKNATILVFSTADQLEQIVTVNSGGITNTAGAAGTSPRASLPVTLPSGNHNLVVIANGGGLVEDILGADVEAIEHKSYSAVVAQLVKPLEDKLFASGGPIPMWGESGVVLVNNTLADSPIASLKRAVARLDIGVGQFEDGAWTGLDMAGKTVPFTLREVYVMRPNDAFSLVPAASDVTRGEPTVPTSSKFSAEQSKTTFKYSGSGTITSGAGTSYTERSIYVPESDTHVTPDGTVGDLNHTERMALVLGGGYDGSASTTYYRVDFADGLELLDVLRNHLYRFEISSVSGPGFGDVVEAYNGGTSNMTAHIVDWNETPIEDIRFVGDKFVSLSKNPVVLVAAAEETYTVIIRTNIPEISFKPEGSANFLPIVSSDPIGRTLTGEALGLLYEFKKTAQGEYTLTITTKYANFGPGGADKVWDWTINAGPDVIEMPLEIRQLWSATDPTPYTVTLTASDPSLGSLTSSPAASSGVAKAKEGDVVKVLASPNSGSLFAGWEVRRTQPGGSSVIAIDNPLTNPLVLEMPAGDVEFVATFVDATAKIDSPSAPFLIYFSGEGADRTLQIGAWDNNKVKQSTLAFFHFGSVVGFDLENASDTWDGGDVLFNPTDIDPATAWNTGDANGYGKIPNFGNWLTATGTTYNAATHRDVGNFVSTAAYHNAEYVQQGWGDPCKLVGLTVDQIRAGVVDNGQWRLPTAKENIPFVGAQNHASAANWAPGGAHFSLSQSTSPNGTTSLNFFSSTTTAKGIQGAYFPGSIDSYLPTWGTFMPAAGLRNTAGEGKFVGSEGYYWLSSLNNNINGYILYFASIVMYPANWTGYSSGIPVRCVPASSEGFSVKVDSQAGGSALANTDMAQPGTEVKAQATASVGSLFAGWRVVSPVGLTVDASANPLTFTMPTGAVILEANFVPAEVEVNGTVWYGANLAEKGVFATSAVEYGALFQWGRDTALDYVSSSTDGWLPDPVADDATWAGPNGTKGYTDPCPVGWRLPTRQEMADLIDTEYVSKLWVTGRNTVFGTGLRVSPNEDSSKLIILPNAGGRDNNNGGAYYRGSFVHYWTSTPAESSTTSAYYLRVYNEITNGSANGTIGKARALSLRCVKDTPKLFNIEVSSADGGTAMANSREVLTGTNVTLQASPSVGMLFAGWEVLAGGSGTPMTIAGLDASKNPVTFTMPAADVSVKAHFLPAEVEVNGTIWAGANVDTPHKFAASAVDYGRLYQFGGGIDPAYANIGWPGAGNTADISASNPGITATGAHVTSFYISSPIWTAAEWPVDPAFNPCPAGWRPPTKNEITALLDANFNTNLKGWVQNYNGGNRNGLLVENNAGDRLFLPTSGYRTSASGTLTSAQFGWYRSITPNEGIMTSILYFERNIAVSSALSDVAAAAIRCVKTTPTGALDLTTEAVLSDGTGGGGSIVVDNPEPTSGSEVKMLATPESGSFLFAGWRVVSAPDGFSLDAAANPVTFTMPAGGVSVEALFLPSEVEINGTVWAGSNLAAAGVFADSAVEYGALFQWGRNVALEYVSGTSGGWNVTAAANDQWIEGARGPADPCPIGWRVPTKAEYDDLYNTTHAAVSKPWSDVEGIGTLEFTSTDGKTLTFTDAGYRDLNGAIRYRGVSGNYWNATLSGTNASHLNFNSSYVNGTVARYAQKVYANAVRCVRHDSYAVAAMVTSVSGMTNNTGGTASVTSDPEGTKPITGAGAGQSIYFSATPAADYLWGGWEVVGTLPDGFTFDPTAQSLTITMPAGAVELRAVFVDATAKIATPVAPYLVYFEGTGADTRLQLGAWDNDKVKQSTMAFFQFGSTVGFQNNDAWNSSRVLFNPTATPESTWNAATVAGYGAIPNFGSWLTANGGYVEGTHRTDNFISNTTSYATSANAKLGYGDPCRLIGLTADQVRAGVAGNDQWRLATTKENILFAGAQNHTSAATWAPGKTYFYLSQSATPNGTTSLNYYDATTTAKGIQGGYFPGTTTSTLNTAEAFLPAAGSRNTTGATSSVGTYGNFWSSSVYNTSNGHSLGFSGSNVSPASSNNYANGYAVRCVSTAEYFVLTLPTTGGMYKLTTVTTNGTALGSSTGGSPIRTSATGSGVSFEAVPATNYAFSHWSVNGSLPADFTFTEEQLRLNPLNFVMPAGEVYLQAVFVDATAKITTPTAPYLVYFEGTGADTRLQLGAWDNDKVKQSTMAFFQFGSLVGFQNNNNAWNSSRVLFNPTATPESTWNTGDAAGYGKIPNFGSWLTANGGYVEGTHRTDNFISNTTSYATTANAKLGYGDPCRLIGLTADQVRAGVAGNGQWRMATAKENILFAGAQNHANVLDGWAPGEANFSLNQSATPNGTTSLNYFDSTTTSKGIQGAYFPGSLDGNLNTAGSFLPAAGYRTTSGATFSVGMSGLFWSSSVYSSSLGHYLNFYGSNVYPADTNNYATGFAVRCVSTGTYPLTAQVTTTPGVYNYTGGQVIITSVVDNGTGVMESPSGTSNNIDTSAGNVVNIMATPATDYVFSNWEVGSGPAGFSLSEAQKTANPLNIVMPAGNVTLRAVFVGTEPQVTTPTTPYLVYFEGTGADTRLQLGAWDNDKVKQSTMAFFQFGSLVGFDIENLSDTWDSTDVLFNPTATAESTWNAASSAGYGAIPNWSNWFTSTGTTYSDATHRTDNYISNTTSYATGANAKNGYGDPCKLIGFTAAQLKAMTAAQIQTAINNAKWRLATAKENILFAGAQNHANAKSWAVGSPFFFLNQSATPNGTSSLNFWDASADATKGIVGAYFPGSTTTDLNTSGAFLPAAGYRNSNGDIPASSIGFVGNLWSSSVQTNLAGYKPGYSSANGVYPTDYAMSLTAAGVRCVSTAPYTVRAQATVTPGTVSVSGGHIKITTVKDNGTSLGTSIVSDSARETAAGSGVSLQPDPNTDYIFVGWEVASGTLTLTEEQKTANPLNIVMPADNVQIRAVFKKAEDLLLYFAADGTLSLGAWDNSTVNQSTLAFFQFGSLIGFQNNNDGWTNTHVKFSPTGTTSYGYTSIPRYGRPSADYPKHVTVADDYVTGANAKLGKGDPCMFVGYKSSDLSGLTAAQLQAIIDAAKWRLPTAQENILFAGAQNHANYLDGWAPDEASFSLTQSASPNGTTTLNFWDAAGDTSAKSIDGGYFPGSTTASLNTAGSFLPAAGTRAASGTTNNVGTSGYFWSSSVYSTSNGRSLYFDASNVYPTYNYSYAFGFAVRCVPK